MTEHTASHVNQISYLKATGYIPNQTKGKLRQRLIYNEVYGNCLHWFTSSYCRETKINSDITFRHVHLIQLALNASGATVSLTIKNSQIFLNG